MTTPCRLAARDLPLVLLASVAHPDAPFRRDLARRLDAAIAAGEPLHPVKAVRRLLRRQERTRRSGVQLNPPLRELVVRLARLAFTRARTASRQRLHVALGAREGGMDGYLIDSGLGVIYLNRSAHTRHREKRQHADCKFVAARAQTRLRQFSGREPAVRAACRIEGRFVLELTGAFPGRVERLSPGPRCPEAAPETLGFAQQRDPQRLRLWAATPEAVLRFSAWLAEGRTLGLRGSANRVLLRLSDFEGDAAELPVCVTTSRTDTWLANIPLPAFGLTAPDRLALARWGSPPDDWVTPDIVEKLF